jgi:hypothetical protein
MIAALDRLAPLVLGKLRFSSKLRPFGLGTLAASLVRARINSRSNSAKPTTC